MGKEDPIYVLPPDFDLRDALQRAAAGIEQKFLSPASTNMLGPKRFITGGGDPVPSKVTRIS